jgi:hypothetical protein
MKPKLIPVLENCIESGIQLGWSRAHKHEDNPPLNVVHQHIYDAIWLELHEAFDFAEADQ